MTALPVISVVIPNLNCAEFLERTIVSVLEQEYPHLDLILADGGSTDGSMDIVERYRDAFSHIISEPDTGQANAVNKGFALSRGEVMGWINSDDVLMPGGLSTVGSLFALNKNIEWLTGRLTTIDEHGNLLRAGRPGPFSRARLLAGDYRWIQQESTYWRRSLWDRAGGQCDETVKLAIDGELWLRFSRHAELVPVHARIGAFRFREGQRSEAMDRYHAEMLEAIERERALENSADDLIKSILDAPLELRSRSEAEECFPAIGGVDPRPLKRVQLWKHKVMRLLYRI
ncbi:glycosyltransferase family 2 protein [Ruegeria halocynthiae]|uniref:glycosyltransferase family 2 protein n=1 Tax=Ruegeria halocynthiae TaxID=985054 RepID=UPI00068BC1F2|nr:glycosyltransferase family 2 protein [Ruegeria halocynthiae]